MINALPVGLRVIVVDNGSTDRTASVAQQHGSEVVSEPRRGYGSAVQAGLRHLASAPPDVVVILDADHADSPELIGHLVNPILDGYADLVLSERTLTAASGALSPQQVFGNWLATHLIRRKTSFAYRDMGPFRAVRWTSLEALALSDPTWGWNVEMQMKAVYRGLRILEVPLPYGTRRAGKSKISGSIRGTVRAGVRILQAVQRYAE